MVAHGGTSVAGSIIQTLTMVDIATVWTELPALVRRDGSLVVAAIKRAQSVFPSLFARRGHRQRQRLHETMSLCHVSRTEA